MESDGDDDSAPHNAFDMLMSGPKAKKQKVNIEPMIFAVIYTRVLRWIDPSEPLHGTPYIGQAVRSAKSAGELAATRWREENSQAKREDKEIGLIACIDTFGPEALDNQVVEWKYGQRSEMQDWANQREIELIAEHGGPLRDSSVACKQTLNLTKGGKGNVNFASRDAARTVPWLKFKKEIIEYIQLYETSLVPQSYVCSSSSYRLGNAVSDVRSGRLWKGHECEFQRKDWLESLPFWTWNANDFAWQIFQQNMLKYVDVYGTSLVPQKYICPLSHYNLGQAVSNVRHGNLWKGKEDEDQRVAWLEALPQWSWSLKISAWTTFKKSMLEYVNVYGTSLVSQSYVSSSGYNLGKVVAHVRRGSLWKGQNEEEERVAWLEALPCWSWNVVDSAWTTFKKSMLEYVNVYGTSLVSQSYVSSSGYRLGRTVSNVRKGSLWKGKEDESERVTWLTSLPEWTWKAKSGPKKPKPSSKKRPLAQVDSDSDA